MLSHQSVVSEPYCELYGMAFHDELDSKDGGMKLKFLDT